MTSATFSRAGLLLVDKSAGMTSHDVVAKTRRALGTRKVGHAGTLDPMATGVLLLGVNSATRLLTFLVGLDKTYEATIRLGESTSTDDAEGESLGLAPPDQVDRVTNEAIAAGVATLTGAIDQVPSSVSAIKVDGKRAYARVREGETVALPARPIRVHTFDIADIRREAGTIDVDVTVDCSSGTYIRALARDLGFRLGVGGHLTALRRTRVGGFDVSEAVSSDNLEGAGELLLAPEDVATAIFPAWVLTDEEADHLGHGRMRPLAPVQRGRLAAIDNAGRLRGIVDASDSGVRVVLNMPQEDS